MNAINLGLIGYDRVGRRVADAVSLQPDMRLWSVYECEEPRRQLAAAAGHHLVRGDFQAWASACDVIIACQTLPSEVDRPLVHGPQVCCEAPLFSALFADDELGPRQQVKIPCASALAFARLLTALRTLSPITRLYATVVRGTRDRMSFCSVDSLEPVFDEPVEDGEIQRLFAGRLPSFHLRRVRAPYTHSHLHFVKVDVAAPFSRNTALRLLAASSRITMARAADGFPDTAHVQEFYRDLGRPRADRPEIFIWEESVEVEGSSLYLFLDVSFEATPIPEIIDAARILGSRCLAPAESAKLTDRALGLLCERPPQARTDA
jgi:glyceraldehyde-3-phosphate dehydrogenase (NAD(P))